MEPQDAEDTRGGRGEQGHTPLWCGSGPAPLPPTPSSRYVQLLAVWPTTIWPQWCGDHGICPAPCVPAHCIREDSQSKRWAKSRNSGRPCETHLPRRRDQPERRREDPRALAGPRGPRRALGHARGRQVRDLSSAPSRGHAQSARTQLGASSAAIAHHAQLLPLQLTTRHSPCGAVAAVSPASSRSWTSTSAASSAWRWRYGYIRLTR